MMLFFRIFLYLFVLRFSTPPNPSILFFTIMNSVAQQGNSSKAEGKGGRAKAEGKGWSVKGKGRASNLSCSPTSLSDFPLLGKKKNSDTGNRTPGTWVRARYVVGL
jgi:hypothetical protein